MSVRDVLFPAMTGACFLPWDLWRSNDREGCCLADVGCLDAPINLPAGSTMAVDVSTAYANRLDPVWQSVVTTFRRAGV